MLVDAAPPHPDSWFEGYGWRVVGASTPCGVVHLGWLYSNGSSEFLCLQLHSSVWMLTSEVRTIGTTAVQAQAQHEGAQHRHAQPGYA